MGVQDGGPGGVPPVVVQQAPQLLAQLGGAGVVVVEDLRHRTPTRPGRQHLLLVRGGGTALSIELARHRSCRLVPPRALTCGSVGPLVHLAPSRPPSAPEFGTWGSTWSMYPSRGDAGPQVSSPEGCVPSPLEFVPP